MAAATPRIIVVGGGLAGLAAVIKIAEAGGKVDLFSIVPVKRSHSVCAQGGINSAKNLKGEGDSTWAHFDDTVYGGDFLANQTPVKQMTEQGPAIIDLLDRMFRNQLGRANIHSYCTCAGYAEFVLGEDIVTAG